MYASHPCARVVQARFLSLAAASTNVLFRHVLKESPISRSRCIFRVDFLSAATWKQVMTINGGTSTCLFSSYHSEHDVMHNHHDSSAADLRCTGPPAHGKAYPVFTLPMQTLLHGMYVTGIPLFVQRSRSNMQQHCQVHWRKRLLQPWTGRREEKYRG